MLALTCGLRCGEILALKWGNLDLDNATLTVAESMEQTNGGSG
jgi:integrase